jgi:lysine/ornithine N-monooxygenase
MLMYLVKKNKDEGEIENDYNDDEDCENCIRMDDANTHTHTHTQTWLSISCN